MKPRTIDKTIQKLTNLSRIMKISWILINQKDSVERLIFHLIPWHISELDGGDINVFTGQLSKDVVALPTKNNEPKTFRSS